MDELGMLLSVILGGLGMFLVVMALSFLATLIVTKGNDSSDMEKILVDHEEFNNSEVLNKDKEVYIIENNLKRFPLRTKQLFSQLSQLLDN